MEAGVVALIRAPKHQPRSGLAAPGKVSFQFEPVSPGQTPLRFTYRQRFQPDVPPAKTVDSTVTVK